METQTPPQIPENICCPGCGRVIPLRAEFCADCGWLSQREGDDLLRVRQHERKLAIVCLGGGLILLALGLAAGDTILSGTFRYVLGPASYLMIIVGFAKLLGVLIVRK